MKKINELIGKILSSFDNNTEGMSAKKLSAFAAMVAYVKAHEFVTPDNLVLVLGVDSALVATLLGLNIYEKIKTKPVDPQNTTDQPQ